MIKALEIDPRKHRKDIDGLRAIAILAVVLFHSGLPYITGGFVGVDVFFVISGFLIGGIIYSEMKDGRFSYSRFYTRRIKRIVPALFFMLIICSAISYFFLSPLELKDFSYFSISTVFSVPNIAMWRKVDYFSPNSDLNPLLMTWSLGVEEQFYIFLPLLYTTIFRLKGRVPEITIFITLMSFLLSVFLSTKYPLSSFYLLPTRAWEMGVGVTLAIFIKDNRLIIVTAIKKDIMFVVGLACILIPCFAFDNYTVFPGYLAAFPVLGSAFIILGNGRLSRILLCNKSMGFVGLISYSWYLWHWPLLSFSRLGLNEDLTPLQGITVSSVAFLIAYFSYKFIETPFRVGLKKPNRIVILNYLTSCFIVAIPLIVTYAFNGFPTRVSSVVSLAEIDRIESIGNSCIVGYGEINFSHNPSCIPQADNNDGIALLGDSHASALRGGVDNYANKNNMIVYQLTKSSCPFLLGVTRSMKDFPNHANECSKFNDSVIKYIISNNNIKKVIISGFWQAGLDEKNSKYGYVNSSGDTSSDRIKVFNEGLINVIKILKDNGKEIILIKDVPLMEFDVIKAVSNKEIKLRHFVNNLFGDTIAVGEYSSRIRRENVQIDSLLNALGEDKVLVYDPKHDLCSQLGCRYISNNRALYFDNQHLNKVGSILALSDLR